MIVCEMREVRACRYEDVRSLSRWMRRVRLPGVLRGVAKEEGRKRVTPLVMEAAIRFVCSGSLGGC